MLPTWITENKLSLVLVAAGALAFGCTSMFDDLRGLQGPATAGASESSAPITETPAWAKAEQSGRVAEKVAQAGGVAQVWLPPPFSTVVYGTTNVAEAYAIELHKRLEDVKAKSNATPRDVWLAVAGSAAAAFGGGLFQRKRKPA